VLNPGCSATKLESAAPRRRARRERSEALEEVLFALAMNPAVDEMTKVPGRVDARRRHYDDLLDPASVGEKDLVDGLDL